MIDWQIQVYRVSYLVVFRRWTFRVEGKAPGATQVFVKDRPMLFRSRCEANAAAEREVYRLRQHPAQER